MSFLMSQVPATDTRAIHVGFRVVTDTGPTQESGPYAQKRWSLTTTMLIDRPEAPFLYQNGRFFAAPVLVPSEIPPAAVLAPHALDARPVPSFDAVP